MTGFAGKLIGGILTGTGTAILERAKQNRENMLLELQRQYAIDDQKTRHAQDVEDATTKFVRDKELEALRRDSDNDDIKGTVTDEQGNVFGYTKKGAKKDIGIKTAPKNTDPIKDKVQGKDGRWYGVTEGGKKVDLGVDGKLPNDDGEPLVEVDDGKGGSIFQRRSDAVGKPGKRGVLNAGDVMAPILQKVRDGAELTSGEQKAWDMYTKLNPMNQLLRDAINGGGANSSAASLIDGGSNAAPVAAPVVAPAAPAPTTATAANKAGVPAPPEYANEPDGSRFKGDDGKVYVKRGNSLFPE